MFHGKFLRNLYASLHKCTVNICIDKNTILFLQSIKKAKIRKKIITCVPLKCCREEKKLVAPQINHLSLAVKCKTIHTKNRDALNMCIL